MKKIKIPIDELITVLEAMKESGGTTQIIIFEQNGIPAICDADEQENYILFQTEGEDPGETNDDGENLH
jgi:hypothetical protein